MDLLSFIIAILPVFLIGLYIYKKDKIKESSALLFQLFMFGIFSCIPSALLGSILSVFFPEMEYMNFFQLLIYVFIVIALVEEFFKWIITYKLTYYHDEFDSSYDMVVYMVFTSLGFACFENVLYVQEYGIFTGILRGVLSVPGHACDGILMGIYLGLAKLCDIKGDTKGANKYKVMSVIIPTITHGIYDFCLFWGSDFFILFFAIFVILIDVFCIKKVIDISKNSLKIKYRYKFCPHCGRVVDSNYCPQCGNKNS